MKAGYLKYLTSSKDLETTYEAIRAGFVALALEKNRRATPFVEQARSLKVAASQVNGPRDLLGIQEIQPALFTAAGVYISFLCMAVLTLPPCGGALDCHLVRVGKLE